MKLFHCIALPEAALALGRPPRPQALSSGSSVMPRSACTRALHSLDGAGPVEPETDHRLAHPEPARGLARGVRRPQGARRTASARASGQPEEGRADHARARYRRDHPAPAQGPDPPGAKSGVRPRPDRPGLHRAAARDTAGQRHHLPAHRGGLAVSGLLDGPGHQGDRRLVDGRAPSGRTRDRRTAHGGRPRTTGAGVRCALR